MESAVAQGDNHYKIDLAPRVIARALMKVGGIA
jgi:xanthine dehydrogenase YagS FAD-binding subunit